MSQDNKFKQMMYAMMMLMNLMHYIKEKFPDKIEECSFNPHGCFIVGWQATQKLNFNNTI